MHIVERDGEFRFHNSVKINDKLEVGNYSLDYDKYGIFLKKESDFVIPDKIYETDKALIRQVEVTAKNMKPGKNLGILLIGEKGQGKTFTARSLCKKIGLPVIMITKSIPVEIDFISFIGSEIKQDVIIFVDEFEKNFPKFSADSEDNEGNTRKVHRQAAFLTLMDGVYTGPGNKVFILSSNEEVDDKLINRPSRLRYVRRYNFIDPSIYDQIINDELVDKSMEKDLRENLPVGLSNIDLLREIVSEINLQKVPYSEFKEFFNFKPKSYIYMRYRLDSKDGWVYKDTIEANQEVTGESTCIAGSYGTKVVDITSAGDIVYRINEKTQDEEGALTKDITTYRLAKKIDSSTIPFDANKTGFAVQKH